MNINNLKILGLFKASTAINMGYSNTDLKRLVSAGILIKLDRSIYQHYEYYLEPNILEFAIACARFGPQAVIAGRSALFYYNLTEIVPNRVWILMPSAKKTTDKKYRVLRTKVSLKVGVYQEDFFKITNMERTLVEAFYYSTKVGLDTAMQSIGAALKQKRTSLPRILDMAKRLQLESVINKHWEALNSLQEVV